MELHIFDFDGTIFFSPAPPSDMKHEHYREHPQKLQYEQEPQESQKNKNYRYDSKVYGQLNSPLSSGGLGWFQSLSSLSPPHVPHSPAIDKWFEPNVLKRIGLLTSLVHSVRANEHDKEKKSAMSKQQRKEQRMPIEASTTTEAKHVIDVDASSSSSSFSSSSPLTHQQNVNVPVLPESLHPERINHANIKLFILTGRDEKYRARIEHLLAHAGILPSITRVFLKPFETAGTVRYKLDTFMHLIEHYKPSHVYYYEDRLEQGGKLLLGVRAIQERLCKVAEVQKREEEEENREERRFEALPVVLCELKEMHDSCAEKSKRKVNVAEYKEKSSIADDEHDVEQSSITMEEKNETKEFKQREDEEVEKENEQHEHTDKDNNNETNREDAIREYSNECRHDRVLVTMEDGESSFKQKCTEVCFDYDPTAMQRAERQVQQWLQNYITTSQHAKNRNAIANNNNNQSNNKRQTTLFSRETTATPQGCVTMEPFHFSMILVPASAREQSTNMLNQEQVDALISSLHAERDEYVAQKYDQHGRSSQQYTRRPYNRNYNNRR